MYACNAKRFPFCCVLCSVVNGNDWNEGNAVTETLTLTPDLLLDDGRFLAFVIGEKSDKK